MKIYIKILLITLPLIVIPVVLVSLVSYRISQTAVKTVAQNSLIFQLTKAIEICTGQASTVQAKSENNQAQITEAQAAAIELLRNTSFGKTGYTMVVDSTGLVISHPNQQTIRQNISGQAWFSSIHDKDNGALTYIWEGQKRLAQYQYFRDWGWYVISSQTESELLGPIGMLGVYISGLLAISLFIAVLAILFFTRRLTAPIRALLTGTDRIRKGEWQVQVGVKTNDEIGILAGGFNNMSSQLRDVVNGLEQRVSERTRDLEQRAKQMQAAAEIAREVTSTHDLETLLSRSVNLIQEQFNFYHTSIYSLDEQRQFAILKAGSGETGKLMVQRGYRVRVGEVGFVSHVAGTGEPRIVNDVKTDFTYIKHPLLPDTACAATLPLKVGNRIIGVLNVENNRTNTFDKDNTAVLQTLADQLAVAIENARLLEELRSSLKETRSLYQNYTAETWSRAMRGNKIPGYQFDLSQITSYTTELPVDIRSRLMDGHALPIHGQHQFMPASDTFLADSTLAIDRSFLLAPLIMYNQLIGVLGVENDDPDHPWSSEEIALMEAISNQVSLSLDNARLVEETQLRSEQIRLLQEITSAAASQVKLKELLETVTNRLLTGFNLMHCGVILMNYDGRGVEGSVEKSNPQIPNAGLANTLVAFASAPGHPGSFETGSSLLQASNELLQSTLRSHKAHVVYGKQATQPTRLIVPLLTRGLPIGTIIMVVADPDRQFDEDALRLLEQIGLQVSTAIEVARNFEQTANRAEHERLIGEMTTRIRETLNVEAMVKTAAKEVRQALGLPEVVIRLGLPTTRDSTPGKTLPEPTKTITGEIE